MSSDITYEATMADLLIRDLAPELVSALDSKALALGISRVEYVRRTLARDVVVSSESVTEKHLLALTQLLPDLGNVEIMRDAWS
jgi:plasmid stability protein